MLFSGSTVLISVAGLLLVRAPVFRTMALGVMVAVALMLAITDVVEVEQMGFALAVAVAVDATLIRIVVVPALLRLTGRANWRFPAVSAGRGGGGLGGVPVVVDHER